MAEGSGARAEWVVVGLGNPDVEYAGTRHNVGAEVVQVLANSAGKPLKRAVGRALSAEVRIAGAPVVLARPSGYYNESGGDVVSLVRRYLDGDAARLVVVHDELDLEPGRLKVKAGGGLAGNNGLKSIKAAVGSDAFVRVRLGIGRPPGRMDGADHVLRRPGKSERAELDIAIQEAADAVELLVAEGPEAAMTRFNAIP